MPVEVNITATAKCPACEREVPARKVERTYDHTWETPADWLPITINNKRSVVCSWDCVLIETQKLVELGKGPGVAGDAENSPRQPSPPRRSSRSAPPSS